MTVAEDSTPVALPPGVTLTTGAAGSPVVRVHTSQASGEVHLHGAHVTSWAPAGHRDVLWMSAMSEFGPGSAIRGGVPICFPWFGTGPEGDRTPPHGFARRLPWRLVRVEASDGGVRVLLRLTDSPQTLAVWPHPFEAEYRVTFGGEELTLSLAVRSTGTEPLRYEEALHTYLAVDDVAGAVVHGLEGSHYLDTVPGAPPGPQRQEGAVRISAETDRVYQGTDATVSVRDAIRTITVAKEGSASTVVWNPWISKAEAMPDFGADEWPWMLCVETANVRADAVNLAPGASHTMTARLAVR